MKRAEIIQEVPLPDIDSFEFVHISDLHFARKSAKPTDRYDPNWLRTLPYDEIDLHEDLIKTLGSESENRIPCACIVSGDLVESGVDSTPYKEVFDNLSRLSQEWFRGQTDRFVIIPGNHDVQWQDRYVNDKRVAEGYGIALGRFYKEN